VLNSTCLAAFAGAGDVPTLSPRRLVLLNATTRAVIGELRYEGRVEAALMSPPRLVVLAAGAAHVHDTRTLARLAALPAPRGAVAALTPCAEGEGLCLLALSAGGDAGPGAGRVAVHDLLAGCALTALDAHRSPVRALAWHAGGGLLASASDRGTVVRVHFVSRAMRGGAAAQLRRGAAPATIQALAFSPPGVWPPLLAAARERPVHVWRVPLPGVGGGVNGGGQRSMVASAAAMLLPMAAALLPASLQPPAAEEQRSVAQLPLPNARARATLSFAPATGGGGGDDAGPSSAALTLQVAQSDGVLSAFELRAEGGGGATLAGQWPFFDGAAASGSSAPD
jgi:autophagy-related protein 18